MSARKIASAALVSIVLLASGCGGDNGDSATTTSAVIKDGQDYTDPTLGTTVTHPHDWTVKPITNGFVLFIDADDKDGFRRNINVLRQPYSDTVDAYKKVSDDGLKAYKGELLDSQKITWSGEPAYKDTMQIEPQSEKLKSLTFYAVKGSIVYIATYTSDPKRFDGQLEEAEAVLNSVELP